MKIKNIYISKWRNIPEQKIFFDTDLTSLIIGQNGLGKSNLLEAMTLIFVAIANTDTDLNLSNFDSRYFSFEIEYLLKNRSIIITYGINSTYQIKIDNQIYKIREIKDGIDHFDHKILSRINADLIPDHFVTYYSGQNKRLEQILQKFEAIYIKGLKANKETSFLTNRRKFMYLKNFHSPILMLVLCIFKEVEKVSEKLYSKKVSNLLQYLGIESINSFSLTLNSPEWINKKNPHKTSEEEKIDNRFTEFIHMYLEDEEKYDYPFWNLKSSTDKLLKCLAYSCDLISYDNADDIKSISDFKETIEFNNIQIEEFKEHIIKYFDTPLELFYALESLVLLDILDIQNDLKFEIIKKATSTEANNLSYESLSEGENQLFIVLGIVLVTGTDETVFLLDEPDTYLNPKWQREYIHLLEDFNLEDDDSHIIATTHSPLLVQNIEGMENYRYDLILLCRNEDGTIQLDQNENVMRNWRIDQVLASKYFDLINTRPANMDSFMVKRSELLSKDNLTPEDYSFLKSIEENDLLPSGETLNDFKAMHLIHKAVKRLPKEND
ncbi:AAA family ATPase [Sphingobacterium sp. SRCM116780]|uniref:AAA family ATPase n=1 Tax=Sphingobacterium sp. SRCM116780 TaxID=2907623 RepID=UPI001F192EBE|nr:AAA family ATPase [Sphingobacterium sp. SRCM116780]UIR56706.1 AAA family ATPase [Sphingobacterium sp. SRCM116780]